MRDWRAYVREHLPALNLAPEREMEIIEELAEQLDAAYREALESGRTEAEAVAAAEAQIPDWKRVGRELCDATGAPDKAPWWTGLTSDVRFGLRLLARQPMFTAIVVLTLTVGLGACVAIYSLLEAVVLRSLPFRDPDRLVALWEANKVRGFKDNVVAPANFRDWQARTKLFEAMSAFTTTKRTLTGYGEPVELNVQVATPNHLSVLGVRPSLGRDFRPDENRGDSSVVLISHPAWQRHFGGRPDIVGQKVMLGGSPYEVVGVLPQEYPVTGQPVDVLAILYLNPAIDYRQRAGRYLLSVGRMKPGVNASQARAELQGIAAQLEQEHPDFNKNWGATVVPIADQYSKRVRTALWLLMGVTALVLLIACANVANLLLARGATREREIAIRCSVGASGWRIARQLLAESLALAVVSGIGGLAFALALIKAMKHFAPDQVPRLESATLNPTVVAFAIALTLGTGLLFGLAPALALAKSQFANTLKEGARGILGSRHGDRWRSALVIAEIALALVLLIGAGLLIRTFATLMAVDPGFDTSNVLTLQVGLPAVRYGGEGEKATIFYTRLAERVRALPSVVSAGSITWLPFDMGAGTGFQIVGRPTPRAGEVPVTDVRPVHPGYFETMRIPVKIGRLFTAEDNRATAPRHFVVNEALVKTHFPNQSPIGQKLIVQMGDDVPGEIIGVIADVRISGLTEEPRAQVYYPHAHLPINFAHLVVRTNHDPMRLAPAAIREVHSLDPLLSATEVQTMEDRLSLSVAPQRFLTALLAGFSAVALFLALIGIYGVMSYTVEQRTHEIGVRLALGAAPGQVQGWIVRRGLLLAIIGALLGVAGARAALELLTQLPFDVKPADPMSYAIGIGLLMMAAFAAVYLPARRATRVDPLVALRYE
jgi:predicted permease